VIILVIDSEGGIQGLSLQPLQLRIFLHVSSQLTEIRYVQMAVAVTRLRAPLHELGLSNQPNQTTVSSHSFGGECTVVKVVEVATCAWARACSAPSLLAVASVWCPVSLAIVSKCAVFSSCASVHACFACANKSNGKPLERYKINMTKHNYWSRQLPTSAN
jgi:hypothetical protein